MAERNAVVNAPSVSKERYARACASCYPPERDTAVYKTLVESA